MVNLLLRSWEFHDFFGCDFSVFVDLDRFDHRDDIGTSGSVHLDGQGDVCAELRIFLGHLRSSIG